MNSFIETLNGRGETFLTFVWPMLWQSSLLIAILLAFDFLVRRKVRASVRYTLWLVVLLKLCLPPTLALPTSPAWWLHKTPAPVAAKPEIHYTVTYDTTPLPEMPAEPLPVYVPPKPSLTTVAWLLSASVLVSSGLLLWLLARWWHITRLVQRAATSEKLTALAAEAQQIVGMKMKVRVKLTSNAMSPAVCGLFHPAILIPQSLAENFSNEQMRAVLLHELIHLRRRDVWMNFMQALLQIAYWWHPLVWLANARIRRVREEAVDDAVMLALNDGAEAYAPTLLEVAKLALNRPLVSLGLVGIMESRNALRQRIERLLDFHPPRQAGLTLVSLLGVLAFTAVAVPMGEGPVPASVPTPAEAPAVVENADVAVSAATEEQSLTVTVDPDIFIRNVKAQAAKLLLTSTNDYTLILMEILRSEDVDGNPPHGLAFNNQTGEITTQNTPDKLETFRRVIEQLNRADGKPELPLRSPAIRRKMVLAESRIYQIRAADFGKFTAGLRAYEAGNGGGAWWSVEPGKMDQLTGSVEAAGLQPVIRPRLQTASGTPAQFFVGDSNNGTELDCIPYVKDGFIDLTLLGKVIIGGLTEAALTNRFSVKASAEDHGGIVMRMENLGGHAESNLVTVIRLEIMTNAPVYFQQRLQTIIKRADGPTQTAAATTGTNVPQVLITAYFCEALAPDLKEFEKSLRFNVDTAGQNLWVPLPANQFGPVYDQTKAPAFHRLSTPRVVTLSGEAARMSMGDGTNATDFDCTPVITNGQVNLTFDFRVVRAQAGVLVTNRFHTVETLEDRGGILVKSADVQGSLQSNVMVLARVEIITNASARFQPRLQKIIKRADQSGSQSGATNAPHFQERLQTIINRAPDTNGDPAMLFTRTYRVDKNTFISSLKQMGLAGAATNSFTAISEMARKYFTSLGVNMDSPSGKVVFVGDGNKDGSVVLFVKATGTDLDYIEHAIQTLNQIPPQIHIKARFLEVPSGTVANLGNLVNVTNAAAGQFAGIISDGNMRAVLHSLESRNGFKTLGEPEVVTLSGRQCQVRATQSITVLSNFVYQANPTNGAGAVVPKMMQYEAGPMLDVVPYVLADGYTINLTVIPTVTEFLGYDNPPAVSNVVGDSNNVQLPVILPRFSKRQMTATLNLRDNQTAVFGGMPEINFHTHKTPVLGSVPLMGRLFQSENSTTNEILVFVTVTIVDPAGNRVHTAKEASNFQIHAAPDIMIKQWNTE